MIDYGIGNADAGMCQKVPCRQEHTKRYKVEGIG